MRRITSTVALVVVLCLLGAALAACTGSSGGSGQAAPPSNAQAVKGEQLVQTKCKMCHSLDRIYEKTADKAGWEQTVANMQAKGLVLTEEEKAAILEYLTTKGTGGQ